METITRTSKRRRNIDLSQHTLGLLSAAAKQHRTTTKRFIEKNLANLAEDYDDAATYARLCQTDPEGLEMADETEQKEFRKWLGL